MKNKSTEKILDAPLIPDTLSGVEVHIRKAFDKGIDASRDPKNAYLKDPAPRVTTIYSTWWDDTLHIILCIILFGCAAPDPPSSRYDDLKDPHHRLHHDLSIEP